MRIIHCRGTGEPLDGPNLLDWHSRPDVRIPYPASYGFVGAGFWGASYQDTVAKGAAMLRRELDKGPAMVVGYSLGAAIAGAVAQHGHPNLRDTILVADPHQPRGIHPHGFGVAGPRPAGTYATWIYNPRDIICCAPADSPVRTIADQTTSMSHDLATWGADLIDRLTRDRWQQIRIRWWQPLKVLDQYRRAVDGITGYLGGEHTTAYRRLL